MRALLPLLILTEFALCSCGRPSPTKADPSANASAQRPIRRSNLLSVEASRLIRYSVARSEPGTASASPFDPLVKKLEERFLTRGELGSEELEAIVSALQQLPPEKRTLKMAQFPQWLTQELGPFIIGEAKALFKKIAESDSTVTGKNTAHYTYMIDILGRSASPAAAELLWQELLNAPKPNTEFKFLYGDQAGVGRYSQAAPMLAKTANAIVVSGDPHVMDLLSARLIEVDGIERGVLLGAFSRSANLVDLDYLCQVYAFEGGHASAQREVLQVIERVAYRIRKVADANAAYGNGDFGGDNRLRLMAQLNGGLGRTPEERQRLAEELTAVATAADALVSELKTQQVPASKEQN